MNELLKQLLEAEVLNADTKQQLQTAFETQINEAIAAARAEAQASVTAELNESWITERDTLIEALDSKVTEALTEELAELRESIEQFRDLEAEFAGKLIEEKQQLSATVKNDIAQLVQEMDSFFEIRLTAELDELRENLEIVRKQEFGKKVFESFVDEFKLHYAGDDTADKKLAEATVELSQLKQQLISEQAARATAERKIKLDAVLSPLSGRPREVMEAILKSVATPMLESAYNTYVGRVLKEAAAPASVSSEKETKVLAEDAKQEQIPTRVLTGDNTDLAATQLKESVDSTVTAQRDAQRQRARKLAGLDRN